MSAADRASRVPAIGAVRYLNSAPLIDGLEGDDDVNLQRDVPSGLLGTLLAGEVDLALCPVIDFQTSPEPLALVPVGAIGSDGETLTVRAFSRLPFDRVERVAVDGDSHTSVALLQVVFDALYGRRLQLEPLTPPQQGAAANGSECLLLIGDKVVTAAPSDRDYPHQLDLGEAWKRATGMPFVFATWMARRGADIGDLPERLRARRDANLDRIDDIVARRAPEIGWPAPLAHIYLTRHLRFRITERELAAVEEFWRRCHALGLIDAVRPIVLAAAPDE
jgi:chorismate dehydratase